MTHKSSIVFIIFFICSISLGFVFKDHIRAFYIKIFTQSQSSSLISHMLEQGIKELEAGNIDASTKIFKEAVTHQPDLTKLLIYLGKTHAAQNKLDAAIHFYESALLLEPRYIHAYVTLAALYLKLEKNEKAIFVLEKAVTLEPKNYEALLELSIAYMENKQFDKALHTAKKAIELQPNSKMGYVQLGHICNKTGNVIQAKKMYEKAITIDPHCYNSYHNLGHSLMLLKQIPQAIEAYKKAIDIQADYIESHLGLAECYWILQDFDGVSKEFEIRNEIAKNPKKIQHIPVWKGQDLQNKRVLFSTDHGGGFGDSLQFLRFAQVFKEKGAKVICKVKKEFVQLLSSYKYFDEIITEFKELNFDFIMPILNAPQFIQLNNGKIPADIPYIKANSELVKSWAKKLGVSRTVKIGLCWHVDPRHETIKSPWALRSVPLEHFIPLLELPQLSFYSLQKIHGEDQLKSIPEHLIIHTFGPHLDEKHGRFMDTAAIMMNLDIIITVDTSIAHLAGSLGKKVWMLLPYACDCRWGIEGDKTDWYPNMRLFRQPKPGDWHAVINEIKIELENNIKKKG